MPTNPPNKTILLIGASRGLGYAMAAEYLKRGWNVVGTVRGKGGTLLPTSRTGLKTGRRDRDRRHREPDQIAALRARLSGRMFDLLFVNAGVTNNPSETIADVTTERRARHGDQRAEPDAGRRSRARSRLAHGYDRVDVVRARQRQQQHDGHARGVPGKQGGAQYVHAKFLAARHSSDSRAMVLMAPGWGADGLGGPDGRLSIEESVPDLVNVLLSVQGAPALQYLDYLGRTIPW